MDDGIKDKELAVFWAQSQPTIAAFIHSLVPNFQDADDILQSVAIITVEKFDKYDRDRSFSAWCTGIAKNLILKYYSKKGGKRPILDIEAIKKVAEVYDQDPQSIHDQIDSMKKALKKCLTLLKGKIKKIVEMHYMEELSQTRIAQLLSLTPNNVSVILHRVRLSLKACVKRAISEELL
ncbi:MAG: sigma-70 family RNA polymerase sigma factor [Planctomycetes bacterium]|nr:sigma-70 family RNA polymerase sigma factor [Planctomycetota bacterium]